MTNFLFTGQSIAVAGNAWRLLSGQGRVKTFIVHGGLIDHRQSPRRRSLVKIPEFLDPRVPPPHRGIRERDSFLIKVWEGAVGSRTGPRVTGSNYT